MKRKYFIIKTKPDGILKILDKYIKILDLPVTVRITLSSGGAKDEY
jgi:hypothetical protein